MRWISHHSCPISSRMRVLVLSECWCLLWCTVLWRGETPVWTYGLSLSSLAKILYSMSEYRAQEVEEERGRKVEKEDIQESKFSTTWCPIWLQTWDGISPHNYDIIVSAPGRVEVWYSRSTMVLTSLQCELVPWELKFPMSLAGGKVLHWQEPFIALY